MAVIIQLSGCTLSLDAWESLIRERMPESLAELNDQVFEEGGAFLLLVEGSIRGVGFSHEGPGLIRADLPLLASEADWRAALGVLSAGHRSGGGRLAYATGEVVGPNEPRLLPRRAASAFCAAVREIHERSARAQARASLPVGAFDLILDASDLPASCEPADVPAISQRLAARVARYATAFRTRAMVLSGGGVNVRVATWATIPTLLPADVDYVAVGWGSGMFRKSLGHVPLDRLLAILSGRAEPVGRGRWFLPGIDAGDDHLRGLIEAQVLPEDAMIDQPPPALEFPVPAEDDPILPVLQSRDWPGRMQAVTRPLLEDPRAPLVAYGFDAAHTVSYLNSGDPAELGTRATAGLDARAGAKVDQTWMVSGQPGSASMVSIGGEYASSLILHPGTLAELAQTIGQDALVVGIPQRNILWAEAYVEDERLFEAAVREHAEAPELGVPQVSPHLFRVEGGRVVAVVENPLAGFELVETEPDRESGEDEEDEAHELIVEILRVSLIKHVLGESPRAIKKELSQTLRGTGFSRKDAAEFSRSAFKTTDIVLDDLAQGRFGADTLGRIMEAEGLWPHAIQATRQALGELLEDEELATRICFGTAPLPEEVREHIAGLQRAAPRRRGRGGGGEPMPTEQVVLIAVMAVVSLFVLAVLIGAFNR